MDDPTLLSWIERGQNIAALLVAIGVAAEFLLGFMAGPARRRVDQAKDAEIVRLTNESAALTKYAAELSKQVEDEKMARVELQDKVAWRSFSQEQRKALIPALTGFAGQLANCSFLSSDMEAFSFSSEIAIALRAAKWRVVPPNPNVITMKETSLPTIQSPTEKIDFGVEVVSTSDATAVAAARAVAHELNVLGFDAQFRSTPQLPQESTVWITVQHRPLDPQGEAKLRSEAHKRQAASGQAIKQ